MANSSSYIELFLDGFNWENRDKTLDDFPLMGSLKVVIGEETVEVGYHITKGHSSPPLSWSIVEFLSIFLHIIWATFR